ncbi:unnamed protein product [Brachionus calyciflorus]|uniref:Cysteine/serine-rich nuclear protein N-terminal domain-containing protein n=1 Tax=Brachionus calyciflorus TaxID=104777 RepID=A0A814DQ09_9BILA|nr:unnamed protein product [Brachionus calyciflorus]
MDDTKQNIQDSKSEEIEKADVENSKSLKSILINNLVRDQPKKNVKFNKVDVYHFERCQGHLSIPSSDIDSNSITLGMFYTHSDFDSFENQDDFLKYKRKADLDKIEEYIQSLDDNQLPPLGDETINHAREVIKKRTFYEENIDEELRVSVDILCPILTLDQRLEKLYKLGFLKEQIDKSESEDINIIRESRRTCGCMCSKLNMICGENGDLCSCYANGINCQIDRIKFPCSCNVKRCKNLFGMKRFNPKQIQEHYKLKLNGKNLLQDEAKSVEASKKRGRKRKNNRGGVSGKRKKVEKKTQELDNSIEFV